MAKKSSGLTMLAIGGLLGAGAMFIFKDKLKAMISSAENMGTAARARRLMARRAQLRAAGYRA